MHEISIEAIRVQDLNPVPFSDIQKPQVFVDKEAFFFKTSDSKQAVVEEIELCGASLPFLMQTPFCID